VAQPIRGVNPLLPVYGVFPRTPADGTDWIHPDDAEIVAGLIPGNRVFCRHRFEDGYYHFRYGETRFRLRPCMWLPITAEGIDIGDSVETIGVGLREELFVSEVIGMFYFQRDRRIQYQLARNPTSGKLYLAEQLRLLTHKAELRPGDTVHPEPRWNDAARRAHDPADFLKIAADDETDDRADKEADRDRDRQD
jgi:hypothetical protein